MPRYTLEYTGMEVFMLALAWTMALDGQWFMSVCFAWFVYLSVDIYPSAHLTYKDPEFKVDP